MRVAGVLGRPSTNRHDVMLQLVEGEPRQYEARIPPLAEGNCLVSLEGSVG
jgi:hypothetical protein